MTPERIAFVTEPLLSPEFVQYQVAAPLLSRLARHFEVGLTAPALSAPVREALTSLGVTPFGGTAAFPALRYPRDELPSYIWSWGRDALLGLNSREINRELRAFGGLRVNYSMTTACDSDCWYVQSGTLGPALESMQQSFRPALRWPARLAGTAIGAADWTHAWRSARHARRIYSSTQHVGQSLAERDIRIRGVMPFFYRPTFAPSTARPTRDYMLGYLGKETDTQTLAQLIELGIPMKIFGSKSPGWVDSRFRGRLPSHVELLGHLTDEQLRDLYSNALFTVFPFTEEPFGLVPVESMACGTPVLTYAKQGPAETVLDGRTGWLATSSFELVERARRVFRDGYPSPMVASCLDRAQEYHVDTMADRWGELLEAVMLDKPEPESIQPLARPGAILPGLARPPEARLQAAQVYVEPLGPALGVGTPSSVHRPLGPGTVPVPGASPTGPAAARLGTGAPGSLSGARPRFVKE